MSNDDARSKLVARIDDTRLVVKHSGNQVWHSGIGWYYWEEDYGDEGSVGAFFTREEAINHFREAGVPFHVVSSGGGECGNGEGRVKCGRCASSNTTTRESPAMGYGERGTNLATSCHECHRTTRAYRPAEMAPPPIHCSWCDKDIFGCDSCHAPITSASCPVDTGGAVCRHYCGTDCQAQGPLPKHPDCDTCNDTGECMHMECYGGAPVEVMGDCPDCDANPDEEKDPQG